MTVIKVGLPQGANVFGPGLLRLVNSLKDELASSLAEPVKDEWEWDDSLSSDEVSLKISYLEVVVPVEEDLQKAAARVVDLARENLNKGTKVLVRLNPQIPGYEVVVKI